MSQMERTLATLQAAGVQPPPEPQPPPRQQLVTPEEVADFGEDLLNVVGKRAREEYAPEFEQLAARLKQLEGRVEGTTTVIQRSQQQEMYDTLAGEVTNWRDINRSDDFKTWLQHPDMLSGRRRHDLLMEAFSRHETPRVVAFFKGFLTEATGTPPTSASPGSSAPPLVPTGTGTPAGNPPWKTSRHPVEPDQRRRNCRLISPSTRTPGLPSSWQTSARASIAAVRPTPTPSSATSTKHSMKGASSNPPA